MMRLRRRQFITVTAGAVLGAKSDLSWSQEVADQNVAAFNFEQLKTRAEELAAEAYDPGSFTLPEPLRELDVKSYQEIRYKDEKALWRDDETRFRVIFRHLGSYYQRPILVNVIDQGQIKRLPYDADLFEYGSNEFAKDLPKDLGFAGFILHFAENGPQHFPEIATFHGASYFRLLGRDQQYGISARGLAIDTALPKGEEFPFFKEFWLEKPAVDSGEIKVLALLDSPSITGAYEFVIAPSMVTVTDVRLALYPRRKIEKLGIAPLTSMFMFGENQGRPFDDFRPEVHDSDGLLIHNGSGEWIWRPLSNHTSLQVSAFIDSDPRGFGLMQRDLQFSHYQDLDDHYQRRPSVWIEPTSSWGPGHVELIEIPSDHKDNDNVVAFWVSDQSAEVGQSIELSYRLNAQLDQPRRPPLGRVESTRIGRAEGGEGRRFVVDFRGGRLDELAPDAQLEALVKTHQGELGTHHLRQNSEAGGWRLTFDLYPNGASLCEMRALIKLGDESVTETWTYRWTPA